MIPNPGLYWWVGLSWKSASMKKAWREVTTLVRKICLAVGLDSRDYINRSRYEVIVPGMGEIWFRTADNPSSLAGEGIRGAVVDEFTLMSEVVWSEYLHATLLDWDGWVAFGGVPKGNNWAARLWREAATTEGWLQIQATTYENPYIPAYAIDNVKEVTPQQLFEQEYLARIVANEGAVFRNYDRCMSSESRDHKQHHGHRIVMGLDFGKQNDFTSISVGCADCKKELLIDRFNEIDYTFQRGRIEAFADRWKVTGLLPERNSMGEPIIEELARSGLPILYGEDGKMGFNTSASTKPQLIENLSLTFERQEWEFIDDPIWNNELASYERRVSPVTGRSVYGAPEGMHDDTVMARALMVKAATQPPPLIMFA